jgi:hypothetical protein
MNRMVAVSQNAITDANRVSKLLAKKKGRNESLRWRSTGWTPLAYPASALVLNSSMADTVTEVNPFFPLDKDVLRAAVRELLILDGSLDPGNLKLKEDRIRFESFDVQMTKGVGVGPVYAFHLQSGKWGRIKEEDVSLPNQGGINTSVNNTADVAHATKRKLPCSIFVSKKKSRKRSIQDIDIESKTNQLSCDAECDEVDAVQEIKASISSAAALVDLILQRARHNSACVLEPVLSSTDVKESAASLDALDPPPRKVSDVDQTSLSDSPPVLLDLADETCGDQDITLFIDIVNRKADGSVTLLKHKIPQFLDVSIVFESSLRNEAYRMLSQTCSSFDSEALRLFLGYKSSALKRERVLRILSDYLFDVSHAMFAWKQTESEILSERKDAALPTQTSFCQEIDSLVSNSLFDERALKKIGGLDDASILRHAIEISRSERRNEPWERFAKTATGRRLLSHHRTGRASLVGQKRRGQRIKRFSCSASTDASDDGQRSRASSIASYDEIESNNRSCPQDSLPHSLQHDPSAGLKIQNLSEVLDLTLTRNVDKSWGVLLSREGDMCVVERAPEKSSVRCGDMVLSVKNERGESAAPPASSANNDNQSWFQDIVNVFKGSNELRLVVRRVGCWVA